VSVGLGVLCSKHYFIVVRPSVQYIISVAAATIGESVSTNLTAEQGITSFAKPYWQDFFSQRAPQHIVELIHGWGD